MYSSNAIQQMRQHLVKQHPLTDFFILHVMLNQEKNNSTEVKNSSLCSTSNSEETAKKELTEQINKFFSKELEVEGFAQIIRDYNRYVILIALSHPDLERYAGDIREGYYWTNLFADYIERKEDSF